MSDDHTSSTNESQHDPLDDEIDLICDAFETSWQRGESPRIEDYLARCDPPHREQLFAELLLVERELRLRGGDRANREDYERRFPEYSTVIRDLAFPTIDDRKSRHGGPPRREPGIAPGEQVAHFKLEEKLGEGASGSVWKAIDTQLKRVVAIKLPRNQTLSAEERDYFLREGQASAQLGHPNIVAVFEVGHDQSRVYIVSEYIDGRSLKELLNLKRPTAREAAELVAQMAEALHHAHEQGVIHRDLKPANILVDKSNCPHIADFGLAKWTADDSRRTIQGNVLGTPSYMSPEQARGDAVHVDRRTDVYSLGALFYEMLTGRPPFLGDVATTMRQVLHAEPMAPRTLEKSVPRDLETICLKALQKAPGDRYPSAQEMAVDLRRFLRGEPILARRPGALEKGWRWLRRHPATAASIALLIGSAVAAFTIWSLQQQNFRLQDYQQVAIRSTPPGARVAIVPISAKTGKLETSDESVVRPAETTPLQTWLKPGQYLVEAVVRNEHQEVDFVETYLTIYPTDGRAHRVASAAGTSELPRLINVHVVIPRVKDVVADMIAVDVDEDLRRKHAELPKLLYVDRTETQRSPELTSETTDSEPPPSADERGNGVPFNQAKKQANRLGKRLLSAAEYEAVAAAEAQNALRSTTADRPAEIEDFEGGMAEWTTTPFDFIGHGDRSAVEQLRSLHVVKGYGDLGDQPDLTKFIDGTMLADPESTTPPVAYRGARSGAPRFVGE